MRDINYRKEKILLLNAKLGNERAFQELIEIHKGQIAGVIIGMMGNTDIANDIGQEVFISFYKNMHQFKEESSLGTYLTRIAINLSLNELKKIKKSRLRIVSDSIPSVIDESQDPEKVETKDLVQNALLQLNSDFRAVIVLRLIEGYSTKEVATILKLPIGTVLSRLSRGQKKLKQILIPQMK